MPKYEFASIMSAIWIVGSLQATTTFVSIACIVMGVLWFVLGLDYKNDKE